MTPTSYTLLCIALFQQIHVIDYKFGYMYMMMATSRAAIKQQIVREGFYYIVSRQLRWVVLPDTGLCRDRDIWVLNAPPPLQRTKPMVTIQSYYTNAILVHSNLIDEIQACTHKRGFNGQSRRGGIRARNDCVLAPMSSNKIVPSWKQY